MKVSVIYTARRAAISILLLVLVALVPLGFFFLYKPAHAIREHRKAYMTTAKGMTLAEVQAIMGGVGRKRNPTPEWWDSAPLNQVTADQVVLVVAYTVDTFYLPVSFTFGFDKDGKLIARHVFD